MADDLEEELDYGLDSPDPKPRKAIGGGATATGSGQPTHAANAANAIGADDDIYGDLFAPAAPPAAGHAAVAGAPPPGSIAALEADELRRRAAAQADALAALQAEVGALKAERTAWRAERATLLTNMSSLFLTAKAELARKDVAIKEARAGR